MRSLFVILVLAIVVATAGVASAEVYKLPNFDKLTEYVFVYNMTYSKNFPERTGSEAVLFWNKTDHAYEFNLTKLGGYEKHTIKVKRGDTYILEIYEVGFSRTLMNFTFQPHLLYIDYPLWIGKTWVRFATFEGSAWTPMGEIAVKGVTFGYAKVVDEETISVEAGNFKAMKIKTVMESVFTSPFPMKIKTTQILWLTKDGVFVKRVIYKDNELSEVIELKKIESR